MVLTRRQLAHARRWLPLWSLVLVLMSFGSRAAIDLCTLTTHCSQGKRSLEKAMPCGSFITALSMAMLEPDSPNFSFPSLYMPEAPLGRLERPLVLRPESHLVSGIFSFI